MGVDRALDLSFDLQTALGTIDPLALTTARVGVLDGAIPELTGTGDGKLWAFYAQDTRTTGDLFTTLYRVDGETFEQRVVLADTGRAIVGAGVSTCAPLVLL